MSICLGVKIELKTFWTLVKDWSEQAGLRSGHLALKERHPVTHSVSSFGGLEVACWPLVPKFAGSHPAEAVGFLGQKTFSTPSFGGEVKPSVPCRSFTACKKISKCNVEVSIKAKLLDISRPQFHLPPLGALAWWHAWRRLVAKVGTSNPDRTISLEGCSA
jgi:hypothetical protein